MYKSQFESLVEAVKQAGAIGIDMQLSASNHRKSDGTKEFTCCLSEQNHRTLLVHLSQFN